MRRLKDSKMWKIEFLKKGGFRLKNISFSGIFVVVALLIGFTFTNISCKKQEKVRKINEDQNYFDFYYCWGGI